MVQKSDESVAKFGGCIRECAWRAKLYELENELTKYFFLSELEDTEIKEKLFNERLATFEDAERRAKELSGISLMDIRARNKTKRYQWMEDL